MEGKKSREEVPGEGELCLRPSRIDEPCHREDCLREEGGRSYEEGGLGASVEDTFGDPGLAMGKEGVDGVLESAAAGNKSVEPACLDGRIVQHHLLVIRGRRGGGHGSSYGGLSRSLDREERGRHLSLSLSRRH